MSGDELDVTDEAAAPVPSTLPEIAGVFPERLIHKIVGKTETLQHLYEDGDHLVLLVEVDPGALSLSTKKLALTQTLDAVAMYDVTEQAGSKDLLRAARAAHRRPDPKIGNAFLPFDDTVQPAGIVDASGVVLTLSDIAEARGFDVDPDGDTITVEFADGTRGCWPDDWAGKGQTLAAPGGHMRLPGDGPQDTAQVLRLLDVGSAEVIAEWSDEDEQARLLAAEQTAEAEEDRAAVAELESARTLVELADGTESTIDEAPIAAVTKALKASTDVEWVRRAVLVEEAGRARKGLLSTARQRLSELEEADAVAEGGGE